MKQKELLRAVKFTLFSISAGAIQILSFTALKELMRLPYWPCYLISLILSVLWNFTFNRRYTFRSAGNVPKAMALTGLFYAVFTPLSTIAGDKLAQIGWNEYLVEAGSMLLNFVTEFLYDKYVVFRGSVDSNEAAQHDAEDPLRA